MRHYLSELIKRRDLIFYLVKSGLKAQHKNSFLGYLWWLIDPFLNVGIYYFIVVVLFRRPGGADYGMHLVTGMMAWRWLASTVGTASSCIISQSSIISKVYMPKSIFPISAAFTHFVNFLFGLIVIFLFFLYFRFIPGKQVLWLPLVVFVQLLFMGALAFPIAYICVFIRDVDNIVNHLMRIWFFSSPVIWFMDMIPEKWHWAFSLNPMYHILGWYRDILIHNVPPDFTTLFLIGSLSLICILPMIYYYSKNEHLILKSL